METHPLKRYLLANRISQTEMARRAGTTPAKICDVLAGRVRRFSPEVAARLSRATDGALTLEQLLLLDVPRSKRNGRRRRRAA